MFKKILFPLISCFLAYQTYATFQAVLRQEPAEFTWLWNLFIAYLLSLFVTGVFAFTGFAYPTHRLLPKAYYQVRNPKFIKWAYRYLGVSVLRIFLLLTFWGKEKNRKRYFDGSRKGIRNFIYQTKQSEFGHFGAGIAVLVMAVDLLFKGYFSLVLWLMFFNTIGNIYPVILQRYHRMRLERIFGKRMGVENN